VRNRTISICYEPKNKLFFNFDQFFPFAKFSKMSETQIALSSIYITIILPNFKRISYSDNNVVSDHKILNLKKL